MYITKIIFWHPEEIDMLNDDEDQEDKVGDLIAFPTTTTTIQHQPSK